MEKPRIVFFGTPDFACAILKALAEEKYNVVAVVAQPDKPVGRKHKIEPVPVHALADALGIPVLQPVKLRDEAEAVLAYKPDLIVTCAYGQFVPDAILNAPRLGAINVHPSLLPRYRGGAPIQYALLNGDAQTGVCLMEMVKAMDAGDVFARTIVPIDPDETFTELNQKLKEESVRLIKEMLPLYIDGKLERMPQAEEGIVIARNISKEQEKLSFDKEELHVLYNHARALIDVPCAYGMIENKRIRFFKARIEETQHNAKPGEVLGFKDHAMEIACIGGILKIYELQPEGKKRMDADAFKNGAGRALIGKCFE